MQELRAPPLLLALLACGCGGAAGQVAAEVASKTAEALLESAANGSASGPACARPCDSGTVCNERSGMCEPYFPRTGPPEGAAKPAPANDDDSCGGLCLTGEHCRIVANADVECVPDAMR